MFHVDICQSNSEHTTLVSYCISQFVCMPVCVYVRTPTPLKPLEGSYETFRD